MLRACAWTNVVLHVAGLALAAAAMRPGTPAVPLAARVAYLSARPAGWTAGWLTWMACAAALAGFFVLAARRERSRVAWLAAGIAIVGALLDLACDAAYVSSLPRRAEGDLAAFLSFERSLGLASIVGANGLYSLAILVFTLHLPAEARLARSSGLLSVAGGAVLSAGGIAGRSMLIAAGTALAIPAFLGWTLALSSARSPR